MVHPLFASMTPRCQLIGSVPDRCVEIKPTTSDHTIAQSIVRSAGKISAALRETNKLAITFGEDENLDYVLATVSFGIFLAAAAAEEGVHNTDLTLLAKKSASTGPAQHNMCHVEAVGSAAAANGRCRR